MAELLPNFQFSGSLHNISAYKMRGSDKIILRTKGGPSKRKIKTSSNFVNTRRNNSEFGGRSTAAKWIREILFNLKHLADHNLQPGFISLLKPIQEMDTVSNWGERSIALSKNPHLLEGYNFNRQYLFDSIIKNPVTTIVSRDDLPARIVIPALIPGINFYIPWKAPVYSFIGILGIIPDLLYTGRDYKPGSDYSEVDPAIIQTGWFAASKGSPQQELELKLDRKPPDNAFSVVLALGIQFGTLADNNVIAPVRYAGSAKILAMG